VALDGSDLRRLTQWYEDDPSLAWSPDGRWLAAQGGSGLRLLDLASQQSSWLRREPAFGAIDWIAE
jgi:Tol biopolymer transport system component